MVLETTVLPLNYAPIKLCRSRSRLLNYNTQDMCKQGLFIKKITNPDAMCKRYFCRQASGLLKINYGSIETDSDCPETVPPSSGIVTVDTTSFEGLRSAISTDENTLRSLISP